MNWRDELVAFGLLLLGAAVVVGAVWYTCALVLVLEP